MPVVSENESSFVSKNESIKYLKYLNKYKDIVGLSDWQILFKSELLEDGTMAIVTPDIWEKKLEVQLGTKFQELNETAHKNILLHELVHGRVQVLNLLIEQHAKILEEHFVNDIVRGLELVGEFEYEPVKKANARKRSKR